MNEVFLERNIYSDLVEKRIYSLKDGYRQNIAIIGDELIGKTSIIFKLLDKFCDHRIIITYLEIRPESLDSFARRFIGVLLYNFLANGGFPLKEDINFLIGKSSVYLPKTVEKIKLILSSLEKQKKNNIFTELLSLCEIIYQETSKRCVVIFDEFHNLENIISAKKLYTEWAKLLILQKNTMYIIISSLKYKTKAILAKNLSLLFGNFETLSVEAFDIPTSNFYLNQKLGQSRLNNGLNNFIVNFTGGHPFYLKVISEALLKANQDTLAEIIEEILFDSSGVLNQRFSNYIKRFFDGANSQNHISILYLISSGHNRIKDIAHILHKPQNELDILLSRLLELDTIMRNGGFLKINDRVFSFWLKFVYQEKLQSLTFDTKNQKKIFRENIENMIQEYLLNAQKTITERMAELLCLFEDDIIQIERRKFRLCHFREIKQLEFNNENLKQGLIGRSSDALWIIAFKHDFLTESDVAEFAKECKKYRHKLQKKIIVAFRDIDANTRLRALEEKIWTWDINNINQIFDLFSKPRVIA